MEGDLQGLCVLQKPRQVARKLLARPRCEGVSAVVCRSIGSAELKYFDPFLVLVLDEFKGFPDHPHRDFEGHKGTIRAGDIQWMTAGRGIVHSEMPAASTGTQKGLQLWINLSSRNKMIKPGYQEVRSEDIPTVRRGGVEVRIIAGESMGKKSPVYTRTPTMYLHFELEPLAHVRQRIPLSWNAFLYVLEGEGTIGKERSAASGEHNILLLGYGDGVDVWNKSSSRLRFLLIGGELIGESVTQLSPFVMNTEEEIDAAVDDYNLCINGFEKAKSWISLGAE